jgi:hypothetical protein
MTKNELKILKENSNGIVPQLLKKLKNGNTLFISKHGNVDQVLNGMDLIGRFEIVSFDADLITVKIDKKSQIKEEIHVFYSTTGDKGLACGFVEKIENGLVYISGTNSDYFSK